MGVLVMSVAPPEGGRNRIMIYGPKRDGTYIRCFLAGALLAIRANISTDGRTAFRAFFISSYA
jgi:hypothetical protein